MAVSDDEVVSNASHNTHFTDIVAARISRRGVLGGGVAMMAAGVLGGGVGQLLTSRRAGAQAAAVDGPEGGPLLGFAGIPTSTLDTVVVPPRLPLGGPDRVGRPSLRTVPASPRTPATPRPTRSASGACTTTASSTSRSRAPAAA